MRVNNTSLLLEDNAVVSPATMRPSAKPSELNIIYIMRNVGRKLNPPGKARKTAKTVAVTASRFRDFRWTANLSVADAAQLLRVSERTIHNWDSRPGSYPVCGLQATAYRARRTVRPSGVAWLVCPWGYAVVARESRLPALGFLVVVTADPASASVPVHGPGTGQNPLRRGRRSRRAAGLVSLLNKGSERIAPAGSAAPRGLPLAGCRHCHHCAA